MSVRTFLRGIVAVCVCLLIWGIVILVRQWDVQQIGEYEVRQSAVTGVVQIHVGNHWVTPFDTDPYAPSIAPADLARVRFMDVAWGRHGILCGRALVAPGPPIQGRAILTITIIDTAWHKRIRERDLRETIDWPGGSLTPFVLRTNLSSPNQRNQKTFLALQPALSSGNE